jgi:hypothetical protein
VEIVDVSQSNSIRHNLYGGVNIKTGVLYVKSFISLNSGIVAKRVPCLLCIEDVEGSNPTETS